MIGKSRAATAEAITAYQQSHGLKVLGIANIETQKALEKEYQAKVDTDPDMWTIIDDEEWDD